MPEDAEFVLKNTRTLPRLLRRLVDGTAADGNRADRTDAQIQDREIGRYRPRAQGRRSRSAHDQMTGELIGQLILWLIAAVIVIFILYWVMHWLYRRSTKEVAFVRTGFLGEKVVINGGAFVWPIIHDITPVSMNSLQLAVTREREDALITRDRMRIDVDAEFYVRVKQTREAVSLAASTLGGARWSRSASTRCCRASSSRRCARWRAR